MTGAMFIQIMLIMIALVAIFVLWVWFGSRRIKRRENAWLTPELKKATLVMVEQEWVVDAPYPLVGRFDRVYEFNFPDGKALMPVDFKTRAKDVVYDTDIAEVSLQAWMLRQSGYSTSTHGYIAVKNMTTGNVTPLRFQLKSDVECEAIIQNYLNLINNRTTPQRTFKQKCTGCTHKTRCKV